MPDKVTTPPRSEMYPQSATPKPTVVLVPRPDPTPDSWYVERRDALMDGDAGMLPAGYTCADQRTEYESMAVAETNPPAATLDSISPNSFTLGGADFALQAIGTNFAADSIIVFDSSPLTTTFVSATELNSATILGSSLTTPKSIPVVVRRPESPDTAALTFSVA
jgi:hypothetical protein